MFPTNLTASYVARQCYSDGRAINRALYEHSQRVLDARRGYPLPEGIRERHRAELALEPLLTRSGTIIFRMDDQCVRCQQGRPELFYATSETHRVINRSGDPVKEDRCWLCVRCWSELKRDEDDSEDLPDVEVLYC